MLKILKLRKQANNSDLNISKRFEYAREAISLSKKYDKDSTVLASNRVLSWLFIVSGQYDSLYRVNKENLKISTRIKDSLKMAYANNNLGFYFAESNKNDSAYYYYYNARKLYELLKDIQNESNIILNMANIQESERDYIGAEINAIKGIEIAKTLPISDGNNLNLWAFNNLIGIVSSKVKRFDKSIEYHNKALEYAEKLKAEKYKYYKDFSEMNIAIVHRRKGDYDKTIQVLNNIKNLETLKEEDPQTYVSIISNLAYAKFLKGNFVSEEIENTFKTAYKFSIDQDIKVEQSIIASFISELYLHQKQIDSAQKYANIAYNKANEVGENQTVLDALILKAKTETGEQSKAYLYEHIRLNDSLISKERTNRNKFARIEFETDEILQEKEQISKQRQWLIFISVGLLGVLFFLYIIKSQREKNKELQLQKQQQEANEEIYKLMLSQQEKIDEARSVEKNRISQEMHDGILGRLFGARLSLDSLNLVNTQDAISKRSKYISELKNIEDDIRKVSHELNSDFVNQSGYFNMVNNLVETQMTAYNIDYTFKADSNINWDMLDNKIKIHLYRILQETMQNIYKHAESTLVDIEFYLDKNKLNLKITDNGVGFDQTKTKNGIGLKNIKDRLKEINGFFNVTSQINKGTSVTITVPNI
ncbi:two-component sensor histidine kinase [Mesoflavibacter zeaxanthinifaciens subsp. sabulilitoris]|uniref:histidine kinase n=1 Tax=Mesoflavibacter zeaxanthinifaciens subsp. sabulilitoris TaxID=1520893 RepID=A0A2T1N811_9FLAO|nr:two-component sensor histidine kinase [Mesoflavibacter zeaxanthinifaciens subsp. sabulilitoris]